MYNMITHPSPVYHASRWACRYRDESLYVCVFMHTYICIKACEPHLCRIGLDRHADVERNLCIYVYSCIHT